MYTVILNNSIIINLFTIFRYILPEDTFVDPEDGRTRQLSITLKTQEGDALTKNSWLQFNTGTQEIYGL